MAQREQQLEPKADLEKKGSHQCLKASENEKYRERNDNRQNNLMVKSFSLALKSMTRPITTQATPR